MTTESFEDALEKFKQYKPDEFGMARWAVIELLKRQPFVTSDDIRDRLDFPNNKIIGCVFGELSRKKVIVPAGFQRSKIKTSHARGVWQWKMNENNPNIIE